MSATTLLFMGDIDDISKSGAQRIAAMREAGATVVGTVDFASLPSPGRLEGRLARLAGAPALFATVRQFNTKVLAICAEVPAPDVCWIEWPRLFQPGTLRELRARWPKTVFVCFQDDNPFGTRKESAIWALFKQCIPEFDLHLVKRDEDLVSLQRAGARRIEKFLGGYSRALLAAGSPSPCQDLDVTFVGTAMDGRPEWLARLKEEFGIPVHAFGGKWLKSSFGRAWPELVHPHANGAAYIETLSRSRICLGFVSHSNRDGFTMRSFEIPALGSFLLAERTPEHAALFREGEEAEFFSSVEECASKIRIYLADKPRRAAVARAGQRRCLENYSMTEAISRALDQANQIRSCEMKP